MTDLEDIAAEANIAIVGSASTDGGDCSAKAQDSPTPCGSWAGSLLQSHDAAGNSGDFPSIEELDALFSHRFTDEDPEYVKTVELTETTSRPPCVENFFVRGQRDNSRGNRRGGGDGRGSYHHRGAGDRDWHGSRGDFRDERNRNYRNRSGWGGGGYRDRSHSSDRGYHYNRESRDSHRSRERDTDRSPPR